MNYLQKYLKYKSKYLLLNQIGGFLLSINNIQINKNIDSVESLNHIVTPMNAYNIVNKDDNNILTTTGIVDCIVILIHNPNYGRYIGHFLKFNDFEEDLSNACQSMHGIAECNTTFSEKCTDINFVDISGTSTKTFINNTIKIHKSLPAWTNDKNTTIHIMNFSEIYKVYSRFEQIKKYAADATIKLYFNGNNWNSNDDIFFNKNFANFSQEDRNKYIEQIKSNKIDYAYQIVGIKPNGDIFGIMKDDLKKDDYINFYINPIINRLSAPNNNKRCIIKYSFNKKLCELKKTDFDNASKLNNTPSHPTLVNPYLLKFFELNNSLS
jgi:hypothetical protein